MAMQTFVLVTGASRGIGKALVSRYLQRPNHVVVAALRELNSSASQAVKNIPRGQGSQVILAKIDSTSESDAKEAVQKLVSEHQIERFDVVIANAGISRYFGKAIVTPAEEMTIHFKINTIAPLLLFQATASLLTMSSRPIFVVLSSGAGSISGVDKLPVENTAYGASKAAVNFVIRRIHYENPDLVAFPINPGWLQTDLGNHAAIDAKMEAAPIPLQEGVDGMMKQIDGASRQETSGKFLTYEGGQIPW